MTQPAVEPAATERGAALSGDVPSPEAVAFIRFCHRRRHAGWPELYDEMCAVAARREFKGWDHGQLATRGLAFSLQDMPKLAGWVRAVVGDHEAIEGSTMHEGAGTPRPHPRHAGA